MVKPLMKGVLGGHSPQDHPVNRVWIVALMATWCSPFGAKGEYFITGTAQLGP